MKNKTKEKKKLSWVGKSPGKRKFDSKEFLRKRILENVENLLKDGFQEIVIKVGDNGFVINPTKKRRKRRND